jgi:hypothetical protein
LVPLAGQRDVAGAEICSEDACCRRRIGLTQQALGLSLCCCADLDQEMLDNLRFILRLVNENLLEFE